VTPLFSQLFDTVSRGCGLGLRAGIRETVPSRGSIPGALQPLTYSKCCETRRVVSEAGVRELKRPPEIPSRRDLAFDDWFVESS